MTYDVRVSGISDPLSNFMRLVAHETKGDDIDDKLDDYSGSPDAIPTFEKAGAGADHHIPEVQVWHEEGEGEAEHRCQIKRTDRAPRVRICLAALPHEAPFDQEGHQDCRCKQELKNDIPLVLRVIFGVLHPRDRNESYY
eukprot:CAMPEP_0185575860 /NCGR_PEP_ID=MMETSP0434-20130131/6933_1 /TAXON_ID=626734 ORGANISM="Favella taraikaensis, Strain Fe Narragansett Bay" /NCGR_SAMPLE_ID=MMETSP0434 /ASSEMBLY_ACC=CAM_ASM_000379 /LENGTH=139 /DNA_ID=CAMNT_0028192855 /DNA_START=373 /DNA_END=790 /DNA_ORIENTATION=-